jgi:hypothetical protein
MKSFSRHPFLLAKARIVLLIQKTDQAEKAMPARGMRVSSMIGWKVTPPGVMRI